MIHGVLNIYKEKGYTSHDVVAKLRGILKQKKIGHTGTLDPDAQGVLPVCLGKGTKLCDMLTDKEKTYRAVLLLGQTTDTQDVTGQVLHTALVEASEEEAERVIRGFEGGYEQIPPMYSALKVDGKKLCDLARAGKTVERKARPVMIHEIVIERMELPRVTMQVTCSKGTYIRTLCQDIGERLGCGGCMESLTRTKVGRFRIEDSVRLEQVAEAVEQGRLSELVIPVDQMFAGLPEISVKQEFRRLIENGNPVSEDMLLEPRKAEDGQQVRLYDDQGCFFAVYAYCGRHQRFEPVKMFYEKED
ncbi:MAG: tRNA pseudouridine(55) synthase TruB [Eubacteriales bacterium]|nr:tRNA pseudouridine(55) synthase TruB [Eubacteriales bacterium]